MIKIILIVKRNFIFEKRFWVANELKEQVLTFLHYFFFSKLLFNKDKKKKKHRNSKFAYKADKYTIILPYHTHTVNNLKK